ncbi:MAG: dephospho-CoA kinase [Bacteroidetes bacterium]|nr:dephospho-CoA kinase [Bacteroidota bacterium]
MKVVGITGGIGSGKSTVCNVFRVLGIPVYEADSEAKKLYDLPEVIAELKKVFGGHYFSKSGELDKRKFADLIFNDETALQKINDIVHPYVKKSFREWRKTHNDKPYVLKEAAILFESGSDKGCDKVITVTAPDNVRLKRVMKRDQRTADQVNKIIAKQWSDAEKVKRSDFVIVNDESDLVVPQVLKIHMTLTA